MPRKRKHAGAVALGKLRAKKGPSMEETGRKGGAARAKKLTKRKLTEIGVKGGTARAAALTPEQRKEIARKAIAARWAKKKGLPA